MSLWTILRLSRVGENIIIPAQYTISTKNYAVEKKRPIKVAVPKIDIPVEKDVNKLLTYVCGSNIYKEGEDVKLKPDSEYPEWLWTIRLEPPKLSELDPNTKQYWRYIRRKGMIQKNKMLKYSRP